MKLRRRTLLRDLTAAASAFGLAAMTGCSSPSQSAPQATKPAVAPAAPTTAPAVAKAASTTVATIAPTTKAAPTAVSTAASAAAPTAVSTTAPAVKNLGKVNLRLNWTITGPHAAYYLGVDRGYWKDLGLDVEIDEGNGSVTTGQLVANKSNTFGLADATALIPAVVKGLPIACVGMVSPVSALAVIARADSGIKTMKDLEGKSLAVTAGDALTQIWPAVVAANHLDASKIKLVYVDAAAKIPTVLAKRVDALLGSYGDQDVTIESKGVKTVALKFFDYGVSILNLGLWVHRDTLKARPEVIQPFLKGVQQSFAATVKDPAAAVDLVVKAKPDLTKAVATQQLQVYLTQIKSKNCADKPSCYNCPADWTQTLDVMVKYEGLKTTMKPEDFYTNEFVPMA